MSTHKGASMADLRSGDIVNWTADKWVKWARKIERAPWKYTAALTAAIVGLCGVSFIGTVSTAEAQLKYTGCLKNNGKIVRVAPGDSPSKPCKKKQTEIMFTGTDKTDALMEMDSLLMGGVTELQVVDVELMDKDDELTAADADLQAQVDALEAENVALQAKVERLMACFGADRFLDLGLTVFDCRTWLEWEKKTAGNVDDTFTWSTCTGPVGPDECPLDGTAFDYIAQLNTEPCLADKCDWRLPEVNAPDPSGGVRLDGTTPANTAELETILLEPFPCGQSPCIDPIFGPTAVRFYWSSVTATDLAIAAWAVRFDDGGVFRVVKTNGISVRAVRSGR